MSFSVDLWNSYDFVESNLMLHYRGLKDFIYLLTEKYKYEKTLSEGLKKIYSTNFAVTTFPSLLEGIVAFKSDMLNQYNYFYFYSDNDIGFSSKWQKPLHIASMDDDVESDDQQIEYATKHCKKELISAIQLFVKNKNFSRNYKLFHNYTYE